MEKWLGILDLLGLVKDTVPRKPGRTDRTKTRPKSSDASKPKLPASKGLRPSVVHEAGALFGTSLETPSKALNKAPRLRDPRLSPLCLTTADERALATEDFEAMSAVLNKKGRVRQLAGRRFSDHPAKALRNDGCENYRIFVVGRLPGEMMVVKVLESTFEGPAARLVALDLDKNEDNESALTELARSVRGNHVLAKSLGGVALKEFGIVEYEGEFRPYVATELIGDIKNVIAWRNLDRLSGAQTERAFSMKNAEGQGPAEVMASMLLAAVKQGTALVDAQGVIDKTTGEVRWIDGDNWERSPDGNLLCNLMSGLGSVAEELGGLNSSRDPQILPKSEFIRSVLVQAREDRSVQKALRELNDDNAGDVSKTAWFLCHRDMRYSFDIRELDEFEPGDGIRFVRELFGKSFPVEQVV